MGNLRKGSYANFLLFTEDLFSKDAVLQENWVAGKNFVVNKLLDQDIRGVYQLTINNQNYDLKIAGSLLKPEAKVSQEKKDGKAKLNVSDYKMALELVLPKDSVQNYRILYPLADYKNTNGFALNKQGNKVPYSITFVKNNEAETKKEEETPKEIGKIWYPFAAFGSENVPTQKDYIIRNASAMHTFGKAYRAHMCTFMDAFDIMTTLSASFPESVRRTLSQDYIHSSISFFKKYATQMPMHEIQNRIRTIKRNQYTCLSVCEKIRYTLSFAHILVLKKFHSQPIQ